MLIEFMTVTGWMFWVAVALSVTAVFALLRQDESEPHAVAVFVAMFALVGSVLFTDAFAGARLWWLGFGFAAYVVIGIAWAVWKWRNYLVRKRDKLRADYDAQTARKDPKALGTTVKSFAEWSEDMRPLAKDHKGRITGYMALWPFSLLWDMLTWPRRLFSAIYARLATVFDRMSAKIFSE